MKISLTKLSLFSMAFATACGGSSGSSKKADPTAVAGAASMDGLLLTDTTAAGQSISTQIDSAISGAAQEITTSATGSSLLDNNLLDSSSTNNMSRYRKCTVSGADADVTFGQSVTRSFSFQGPRRSYQTSYSNFRSEDRVWSSANGSIACDASGKYAAIQVKNLAGVSLAVTTTDERSRTSSLTNLKTGATSTPGYKYELKGTRNIAWSAVTLAGSTYEINKTVTHNLNSTMEIETKDGSSTTLSSSIATKDGAPLVITVDRDSTSLAVLGHTLTSGTVESTHPDGTRVESVFNKVVYNGAASEKCVAASGEIDGSIFPSGATTASMTFKITFGDAPAITFSNGDTVDYNPEGCDFDDVDSTAVDVDSQSAVTAPANVAPATAPTAPTTAAAPASGT